MTVTVPELRGSRLDTWWRSVGADPRVQRAWRWGAPGLVLLTAAVSRLAWLGTPHQIMFDETYYVKDAWTLSHLGYEAHWPADFDDDFAAGDVGGYLPESPSFVAHPQIGKWLIALGMLPSGGLDPAGWRISVAIAGVLIVVATMVLAELVLQRRLLTLIAGGLVAIDGNAIVMSRVALLDNLLALLALLGVIAVVLDRRWAQARLAQRLARGRLVRDWGPMLLWRPWLVAAGLAFGLASGVKWSGAYFLAAFGIYSVLSDAWLRKQAGIGFWLSDAVLRQGPINFLLMVPIAVAAYVGGWFGWFLSDGGYYRHWADAPGNALTGAFAWIPHAVQSWWHYQQQMWGFNISADSTHPYSANPLGWPWLLRPTSVYYQDFGDGTAATILDVPNPIIWWAATLSVIALFAIFLRRLLLGGRVAPYALILTGFAAGYLPWLLYLNRTVFFFYSIAYEPYLLLALTAVIGLLLGSPGDLAERRERGLRIVLPFLAVCAVVSVYFYPVWTGELLPQWLLRSHFWLGNLWI